MRIENETKSASEIKNPPFLQIEDHHKLITEIEKYGRIFSFSENLLFNLPYRFIFNEIKNKLKASFERWIFGTRELRIYVFPFTNLEKLPKIKKFKKNSIEDLLLYKQTSLSQPTRKSFLKRAEKRFAKGMSVYTFVEDNDLQAYM